MIEVADAIEWDVSDWIRPKEGGSLEHRLRSAAVGPVKDELELAALVVEEVKRFSSSRANTWDDGPMSLPRVGGSNGLNKVLGDVIWYEMTGRRVP